MNVDSNHNAMRQGGPDHTEHAPHQPGHVGAAHDRHAGHSVAMFRDRFWLSLALSIPVFIWSPDPQAWLGYTAPTFPGSDWIPPILGTVVFLYGGLVFLRGARGELAGRQPGMMTLISLAIVVAFVTSWAGTLGLLEIEIWWELSSLIVIMLLGHWLEMRSIAQARGAVAALAELLPDTAERVIDGGTETVALDAIGVDDVVLIRPGGRVPVDGIVVDGSADVDESLVTGESRTVPKAPGDPVVAGTVAAGGSLRVRVTAVGEATALSGIMRMVAAAQASSSRAQALADRAAAILFYVALVSAAVTFTYWWLAGEHAEALTRTATVLVIACPHALGLAIPLVIAISTSLGARHGLLVKNRISLERARDLDVVIFDKTGTLTRGTPTLASVSGPDARRGTAAGGLRRDRFRTPAGPCHRGRRPRTRHRAALLRGLRGTRRSRRPGNRRRPRGRGGRPGPARRCRPGCRPGDRGLGPRGSDGPPRDRRRQGRRSAGGRGRDPARIEGGGGPAPWDGHSRLR